MLSLQLTSMMLLNRIRSRRRRAAMERRHRYFAYFRRRQRNINMMLVILASMSQESVPRSIRSLHKSMHWWNNVVLTTWDDQLWLENFRMTKSTFNLLLEELKPHISKQDTRLRKAIPSDQRLAITLWRLATNIEYTTLAELFGVGTSSVCSIFQDVVTAITNVLGKQHITIPKGQRLQDCIECFEDKGFSQAAGVIDCCHIPIRAPPNKQEEYINRSGFTSLVLQAVVDSFGQFIDIDIGCPGSMHDAGVFSTSEISSRLEHDSFFDFPPRDIQSTSVPVVLLGDDAYPLMPNLMIPYDGTLTPAQSLYNQRHQSCHATIQHALERLQGRWNILAKTMDIDVDKIPSIVRACCVLHNVVESHNDPFLDEWTHEDVLSVPHGPTHDSSAANATSVRNALTQYFMHSRTGGQ